MGMRVALRAATQNDRLFVESVYFDTQRWVIEHLFGWRGDAFEHQKFADWYKEANTSVVTVDDQSAGWLMVDRQSDCIQLEQIYLSSPYQNRGIGTLLIKRLIAEARATGVPLRLSAAKINPATHLYERLGFVCVGESEFKIYMEVK
jgi:GNAT superfamily N-acetyltransferase